MLHVIIGIDDTDNAESRGTGSIATEMCELIEGNQWGTCDWITRHQLFLHPDIAYTSHNSAMIFTAMIQEVCWETLQTMLQQYLERESAEGSDPGICMGIVDEIQEIEALVAFGYSAKRQVRTKAEAYALAKQCGLSLTEHGGAGIGVIGALAGVALRLEGNDGEVKGGLNQYEKGSVVTAAQFLQEPTIFKVCTEYLEEVAPETQITVQWKVKPVLAQGKPILLVGKDAQGAYHTLNKKRIREFGEKRANTAPCSVFAYDVEEELVETQADSCFNCRYRRWSENGFTCMKGRR